MTVVVYEGILGSGFRAQLLVCFVQCLNRNGSCVLNDRVVNLPSVSVIFRFVVSHDVICLLLRDYLLGSK